MKKVFLYMFFMLSGIIGYAQDPGEIDINNLHSADGKKWIRSINPDGKQFSASMADDVFIFYSDGTFKYDQSGTESIEFSNVRIDNKWSFDSATNTLSWNLILPNNTIRKISCEIMRITSDKFTVNLSEGQNQSYLIVFRTK